VLQGVMAQVDAGVSVSLWEGFNLPLAEMQWIGKPVVVFDAGAHPEVVAHPYFLAPDVELLVERLAGCLLGNALRHAERVSIRVPAAMLQLGKHEEKLADRGAARAA
jgi:glycosyltransferase involved in cell wall biosynthesis